MRRSQTAATDIDLHHLQAVTLPGRVAAMAKYKIAWMPGDGVGKDVMEATRIVLDA